MNTDNKVTTLEEDKLEKYFQVTLADNENVRNLNCSLQLIFYQSRRHGWDESALLRYSQTAVNIFFLHSTCDAEIEHVAKIASRLMVINKPRFEQAYAACSFD